MVSKPKQLSDLVTQADVLFEKLIVANRGKSNSAYNRVHLKLANILDKIEAHGETGQRAINTWLESDEPLIRLFAAVRALGWNSDVAIPVLGHLLVEPLPVHFTGYERFSITSTARSILIEFFKTGNFSRNSLIEPLKAYGIDLPRRPEQIWLD